MDLRSSRLGNLMREKDNEKLNIFMIHFQPLLLQTNVKHTGRNDLGNIFKLLCAVPLLHLLNLALASNTLYYHLK